MNIEQEIGNVAFVQRFNGNLPSIGANFGNAPALEGFQVATGSQPAPATTFNQKYDA
jgi:hypothetical protein